MPKEPVAETATAPKVRKLLPRDLAAVIRIDAAHRGASQPAYWRAVFSRYLRPRDGTRSFGLGIDDDPGLIAFLFGEVRAFEFGAEPAGWIFAVGVDPSWMRRGHARALLDEARRRFTRLGIDRVRTMVRRDDVPILAFFRTAGFVGGPFVQLELRLPGAPGPT